MNKNAFPFKRHGVAGVVLQTLVANESINLLCYLYIIIIYKKIFNTQSCLNVIKLSIGNFDLILLYSRPGQNQGLLYKLRSLVTPRSLNGIS